MKVLFVASELTPIAKVGGLGDVVGSLPKALFDAGVDVSVVIPKYEIVDERKWKLRKIVSNWQTGFSARGVRPRPISLGLRSALGGENEKINVYQTNLSGSKVKVFLIENEKYLSRGPVYFEHTAFAGRFKEIQRFLFFSKAVFELFGPRQSAIGWKPDIVHCNDWHTGALVSLLSQTNADNTQTNADSPRMSASGPPESAILPKVVFTIHNLGNQGKWNATEVTEWFGKNNFIKFGDDFNFIAEGILNADVVTTVSPTYAKEILTKEYGMGLETLLLKRRKQKICVGLRKVCVSPRLVGILNGIDYGFWLKKHTRLDNTPTFGLVSRLTYQKGIDLIAPLVSEFVEKYGAEFNFLGSGEKRLEDKLLYLAKKHPKKVFVKIGFDEKLAQKIYRDCDFFLMPSIFEPCGLGQMISMHYGTIPIVRETGGLKDSVKHLKTGFVFKEKTPEALAKAMKLAVDYFYNKPKQLKLIQKNCRRQDFSWFHSAQKYKALYKNLLIS